jgi:DNA polymerase
MVPTAIQATCAVHSSERARTRIRNVADKAVALRRLARQTESCRRCRRGGIGKAVVGERSADARIVFVGEAPGRHEAESGRPFVGQAGQWLRRAIRGIGLDEEEVYLTSPIKYRPKWRKPTAADIAHGRVHLRQQIDIINPRIVVLLGSTACLGVLKEKIAVRARHGSLVERNGRTHLITCHPAAAARFPAIRRAVQRDFRKLRRLVMQLGFARSAVTPGVASPEIPSWREPR